MPTPGKYEEPHLLDPNVPEPKDPFKPTRNKYPLEMQRVQSGGLDDDPTDSGDPVRDRVPYKNLKGGR